MSFSSQGLKPLREFGKPLLRLSTWTKGMLRGTGGMGQAAQDSQLGETDCSTAPISVGIWGTGQMLGLDTRECVHGCGLSHLRSHCQEGCSPGFGVE